jgi:hypothetical protein
VLSILLANLLRCSAVVVVVDVVVVVVVVVVASPVDTVVDVMTGCLV